MGSTMNGVSRRRFAGMLGLLGAGTVGTALAPDGVRIVREPAAGAAETGGHDMAAMTKATPAAPAAASVKPTMTADEMDAMHEAGIKSFPAPTQGLGGQPLPFEMDGDVKVFRLTCQLTQWEFAPGKRVEAWTYNGVVPGPELRVTEGDKVRIEVANELPESTAVHWHGLMVPASMDGVPFISQPPIKPGQTFTYEFQVRDGNAGTHMYHSHHNAAEQVTKGLLGSFVVEPRDPASRPAFDREYTIVLNDGPIGGYSLNGKSFPATQPFAAKKGERVLFRFMNEGLMIHPMHLHGMPMTAIAQDGYLSPQPYMCDTLNIVPGQRFEAIVHATEPGTWAFHCHILNHAESDHGMFGMVTALIVEE
ncbi:MAG: multicopper oxidase domain-containing protein [Chloroflexota bacterium]|nr:multicopper oxidase domain-containing protein [Chloroflexota bacterium]